MEREREREGGARDEPEKRREAADEEDEFNNPTAKSF